MPYCAPTTAQTDLGVQPNHEQHPQGAQAAPPPAHDTQALPLSIAD